MLLADVQGGTVRPIWLFVLWHCLRQGSIKVPSFPLPPFLESLAANFKKVHLETPFVSLKKGGNFKSLPSLFSLEIFVGSTKQIEKHLRITIKYNICYSIVWWA